MCTHAQIIMYGYHGSGKKHLRLHMRSLLVMIRLLLMQLYLRLLACQSIGLRSSNRRIRIRRSEEQDRYLEGWNWYAEGEER